MQALCHKYDIKMTTTASYSPNQNGLNEKNHHYVDFMMSKMILADPACSPEIALTWAIHASNVLENRYGVSPSVLVFGRNVIAHPDLCPTAPSTLESEVDVSKKIATHLGALSKAREAFIQAESSKTVADALKARVVNRVENIEVGKWIYYKNLENKHWQGPVKVVMIDNKNVFTIKNNKLVSINKDHVVLQRTEEDNLDDLLTLPPLPNQEENLSANQDHPSLPGETQDSTPAPDKSKKNRNQTAGELEIIRDLDVPDSQHESSNEVQEIEVEDNPPEPLSLSRDSDTPNPITLDVSRSNTAVRDLPTVDDPVAFDSPVLSSPLTPDTMEEPVEQINGSDPNRKEFEAAKNRDRNHFKVSCNTCNKQMLRASVVKHARNTHYLKGTWQELSRRVDDQQRSLDSEVVTGVDSLDTEPPQNQEASIEEDRGEAELTNDQETSDEGEVQIYITSSEVKEDSNVYHVLVPKDEHSNKNSYEAKMTELKNFEYYDVYEVVDKPKEENIIATQWVLVDKEVPGEKELKRKARLCMRGDQEKNVENISKDAPTVNKMNIKLMLMEAVRQGWDIESSDVTRAFLQTSKIERNVYVKPPIEAGLPTNKVWKLRRPAYGLIDAAHSFFVNYADNLIALGCEVCKMDNATFYHFEDGSKATDESRNLNGIIASHIDDSLIVSNDKTKNVVVNKMKERFTFGSHETLPFRYVGLNIENEGGKIIINQDHFVDSIMPPDMTKISSNKKAWVLNEEYQTKYRSLVSKLNILSMSARPDISFEVKVLTTRYGKGTKLDLMKAVKVLQKVKRKTTKITVPDMGEIKDCVIVAYSDAATKKIDNAFSVAGHVIFLVNKKTNSATPITWSSKKIERVVNSSLAAETLAVVKIIGAIFFIKEILKQMYGKECGDIPCLTLTDSKDLYEAVHNVKNTNDKRLLGDILQIKQAMAVDGIIEELRHVPSHEMLADSLTKEGVNGEELLNCVRTGILHVRGGLEVLRSKKLETSAWRKLIQAQSGDFMDDENQI